MNQIWNHNHWWISKIDFFVSSAMLILCLMFLRPLSLERRRLATCSLKTQIPEWLGISIWNLGPINKIRSFVRGSPWWSMSIKTNFFQFFVLIYLFVFFRSIFYYSFSFSVLYISSQLSLQEKLYESKVLFC